ncbi:pyridoxamine 5'-phosphate oxidase family protein [Rhizocola hellebori]|uniref:pyridoxamine 5'-phosphate oxidase family protein n=1 Tax=Rhizocola hellebori TaxID=1392758 RepID=UPI0019434C71|nr:pyridoxamine 5'-phosphate oxidase family protein [Rhizocola hellebori]
MTPAPARSAQQRKTDTLARLENEVDAWVATADPATGLPYLVPLSFLWEGGSLYFSTAASNPTARNLEATGQARIGVGLTRDVVLIEGAVQVLASSEISLELGDAFAAKTGFDPRTLRARYLYFRVTPVSIQAWREVNELAERNIMLAGQWAV